MLTRIPATFDTAYATLYWVLSNALHASMQQSQEYHDSFVVASVVEMREA